MAIPVFIAYARVDAEFKDALIQHLAVLVDNGTIKHWHDQEIPEGTEWEPQIDARLREARLIVLLVSSKFLASRYCKEKEMASALLRDKRGEAVVLPILVRRCLWDRTELARLQILPMDAKPINTWPDQDEAWTHVVARIEAMALKLSAVDQKRERRVQEAPKTRTKVEAPAIIPNQPFPWHKARWPAFLGALIVLGLIYVKARQWFSQAIAESVNPSSTVSSAAVPPSTASMEIQDAGAPDAQAPQPSIPQAEDAPPPALADIAPMKFKKLPAGSFMMGSPGETDPTEFETQHSAEIVAFEIAIHEVTQKQWKSVMGSKVFDCTWGCKDEMPAANMSWFDALAFMNKLTELENKRLPEGDKRILCYAQKGEEWIWNRACTGYRLPTEAEWEYAARAGTTTAYSFGDDAKDFCSYGNGGDAAAKHKHPDWILLQTSTCEDDKFPELAPIGSFKPNPWGLYDMHGNVSEWTWDLYAEYPPSSKAGYAGPDKTAHMDRVLRGGSFSSNLKALRSSNRQTNRVSFWFQLVGFRCVRNSPQP